MKRVTVRKVIAASAVLAAALAAWFLLAPQSIGGSVSYLVVNGTSMNPRLAGGDLVVVRSAERYSTGEIVAYRNPVVKQTFVHRIVGEDNGAFELQGDANPYPDAGRARPDAVYGKLWFSLPYMGSAVSWLSAPVHAGMVGGALVLLLFGGSGAAVHRRRHRRHALRPPDAPRSVPVSWERRPVPLFARPWALYALFSAGVALAVVAGLAIVAYSRGATTEVAQKAPYRESGSFSYWADVPAGVVYQDGRVDTGEPVFVRLVDKLQTRFDYRLHSDAGLKTTGRIALAAVVSDPGGWRRTIELRPASQFEGGLATIEGTLDLERLRQLIAKVERTTGVAHESYSVTLAPTVEVLGSLGSSEVSDRFAPTLRFRLDGLTLAPDEQTPNRLTPTRTRSVTTRSLQPAAVSFAGAEVSVRALRRAGLAGSAVLVVFLLVVGVLRARALRGGEHLRIAARYGSVLVPVSPSASEALGPLVDVATMDGLVRLAEPSKRPILHSERLGTHSYYVEDGGVVYRYSTGGAPTEDELHEEEAAARLRLLGRHA